MAEIEKEEKNHWKELKRICQEYGNGKCIFDFQDGLPVIIIEIEGKKKNIDLTRAR